MTAISDMRKWVKCFFAGTALAGLFGISVALAAAPLDTAANLPAAATQSVIPTPAGGIAPADAAALSPAPVAGLDLFGPPPAGEPSAFTGGQPLKNYPVAIVPGNKNPGRPRPPGIFVTARDP